MLHIQMTGLQNPDASELAAKIHAAASHASRTKDNIDAFTVGTTHDSEDSFFSTSEGVPTVTTRYDLEKEVERRQKPHFEEIDRYWVTKPFAFIILFRSRKENEIKYYAIEPHLNPQEERVIEFLQDKLKETIKFEDEATKSERSAAQRAAKIEKTGYELLLRYNLIEHPPVTLDSYTLSAGSDGGQTPSDDSDSGVISSLSSGIGSLSPGSDSESSSTGASESGDMTDPSGVIDKLARGVGGSEGLADGRAKSGSANVFIPPERLPLLRGGGARSDESTIAGNTDSLTEKQAVKIMYYLKRDAVSYSKIDPIKHDIQIEDISCDGYNQNVWVYHEEHEQIITNISHGETELDDFVVNIAQRSGKGISKRKPQVDVTLPDGSRGQLTLGDEISDRGTNYTIRQFNEVPYTPVDLVNWKTFDPEQMAFLWLAIENEMSLIIAGGTASGKTTSLNAVSLFVPSNTKIVSIEDTREVELPQQNWVASVTRASFTEDGVGEVDEFDLLEAALRQRPDYIIMGEIRGEEGRTLFQVMSTGHTTYTTFHADSVGEVIKRFTTDPINVSKTLFTSVDLISVQTQTQVGGNKARRSKTLTEVNNFRAGTDEINVSDVYKWNADGDTFERAATSSTLEQIKFDRGWDDDQLSEQLRKRQAVLAYLITNRVSTYADVAATIQAFLNGPDIVLDLMANGLLEESLGSLREMESVEIDIDPETENMVPRPEPPEEVAEWAAGIMETEYEEGGVLYDRGGIDEDGAINDILMSATPANEETGDGSSTGSPHYSDGEMYSDSRQVEADTSAQADQESITRAGGGSSPNQARASTPTQSGSVAQPNQPADTEQRNHTEPEQPATGDGVSSDVEATVESGSTPESPLPSEGECREGIAQVGMEIGHPPSQSEYRSHRDESDPSATEIKAQFDSWEDACGGVSVSTDGQQSIESEGEAGTTNTSPDADTAVTGPETEQDETPKSNTQEGGSATENDEPGESEFEYDKRGGQETNSDEDDTPLTEDETDSEEENDESTDSDEQYAGDSGEYTHPPQLQPQYPFERAGLKTYNYVSELQNLAKRGDTRAKQKIENGADKWSDLKQNRPEVRGLIPSMVLTSLLLLYAGLMFTLTTVGLAPDSTAYLYLTGESRVGDLFIGYLAVMGVFTVASFALNPVWKRLSPERGHLLGTVTRWALGGAQVIPAVLIVGYVAFTGLFPGINQLVSGVYQIGGGLQSQLPSSVVAIGEVYYSQLSPFGYAPADLTGLFAAASAVFTLPFLIRYLQARYYAMSLQQPDSKDPVELRVEDDGGDVEQMDSQTDQTPPTWRERATTFVANMFGRTGDSQ